jgi:hypothetical protein
MDCSSARLFLQFARPGGPDLDGPEAGELEAHLAHCSECNALALTQDRLDQHLGRAMLAVEVPRSLKAQIVQRLASERGAWYRRPFGRVAGILAAAAALLLLVGGWYAFYKPPVRQIALDSVLESFIATPPGEEAANELLQMLANRSVPRGCAPHFVNYEYLIGGPSLAILPGTQDYKPVVVPQFIFSQPPTPNSPRDRRAVVFALPRKMYELENLTKDHGYPFQLEKVVEEKGDFVYLILHTGKDRRWLDPPWREGR